LSTILKAIQSRKVITFDYTTFDRTTLKSHTVHPYLLKNIETDGISLANMTDGKSF